MFQVGDSVRFTKLAYPTGERPIGKIEFVNELYQNGIGVRWPSGSRYCYAPDVLEHASGDTGLAEAIPTCPECENPVLQHRKTCSRA